MSEIAVNAITDASGGSTASINGYTPTVSNMAGRNRIINGDMRVAQRGTSGTTTSSGYVSLDRWRAYISTSSTVTLSQQTFTPGQTDVSGDPEFFMRYDWLGTGSPSTKIVMQRIENVKSLVGAVTLSFYAKTELGDNIDVEVYQNFGSGGSTEVTAIDQTIDVTDAWAKYTVTFTLPSLSGKTIGASSYIEVSFASRDTTANSYLDLADVQLEAGSVATPFERRQYGQELALCQRYYEIIGRAIGISGYADIWSKPLNSFTNCWTDVRFKVEKRAPNYSFGLFPTWAWAQAAPTIRVASTSAIVFSAPTHNFVLNTSGFNNNEPAAFVSSEL